eukprot:2441735-Karenia_brevis.AAC.1
MASHVRRYCSKLFPFAIGSGHYYKKSARTHPAGAPSQNLTHITSNNIDKYNEKTINGRPNINITNYTPQKSVGDTTSYTPPEADPSGLKLVGEGAYIDKFNAKTCCNIIDIQDEKTISGRTNINTTSTSQHYTPQMSVGANASYTPPEADLCRGLKLVGEELVDKINAKT